jgi:hypothetical protein
MATTLLTVLQQLADKAGIPADDATLTTFFQNAALNSTTVPDEVISSLNKNLISLDDAKNNHPQIKSHYFAEIMANVDRSLSKVYQKLELDEDLVNELAKETSSTKRIALLGEKLSEVMQAKLAEAGKGGGVAKEALTKQIDDLNAALRAEKEARTAEKSQAEKSIQDFKIKTILTGKYSGLKTVYDTLPADAKAIAIETLLNKEFQDSSVRLSLDENGNLKLTKSDDSNYYDENNRLVTPDDFIQRTLAKNKILSQSAPVNGEKPKPANGQQGQNGQPDKVDTGGQKNTVNMSSLFSESNAAFDNPNPVDIASGMTKN